MRWLGRYAEPAGSSERGAAGVTVAVMMLVLIGTGAVAVDVGQIYAERAQLQNGADAGAMAVAKSCDPGPCTSSLAGPLANANSNDAESDASVDLKVAGQVTVTTSTRNGSSSFLTKLFANALNTGPVTVGATATAAWGWPGSGPAALPLTFAPCQFDIDGAIHTILTHGSESCVSDSPSGAVIDGGFAWLKREPGKCEATVHPDDPDTTGSPDPYAMSDPGGDLSKECKALIPTYLDKVILFPVFSPATGAGANGKYYIKGYAAFRLKGYHFPGASDGDRTGLGGNNFGIRGQFVSWEADPSAYGGGGYSGGGAELPAHLVK